MRTLPKPWIPPHPREIYAQHLNPTDWRLKERKYQKSHLDMLTPIATLAVRGMVTAEAAHREAMQLARDYVRRGLADNIVVSAARMDDAQHIHVYARVTLCPEGAS